MLRQLLLCCVVVAWFAAPAFAQAPADTADPDQAAAAATMAAEVNAASPGWTAGHTSVSDLSWEDKLVRCGTILTDDGGRGRQALANGPAEPQILPAEALPPAWDWRDVAGRNFVTPVRNQQNCGSCWAFATLAAFESRLVQDWTLDATTLDLSEQALASCSLAGSCDGGFMDDAALQLSRSGVPSEACFPYLGWNAPCALGCAEQTAWPHISTAQQVYYPARSVDALKSAVATYGPVAVGFVVFADFYTYTGGVYRHVTGDNAGGHGVCIVGYDDAEQCFIVKNSWGPAWGEDGFFRIAYDQMDNEVKFGMSGVCFASSASPEAQLLPLVSINGSAQQAACPADTPVTVAVGLVTPAPPQGAMEWWLVCYLAVTGENGTQNVPVASYVLGRGWVDDIRPMHVGPVGGGFPGVTVLKRRLDPGTYTVSFGMDPHPDGNFQPAWQTSQIVTVKPPAKTD